MSCTTKSRKGFTLVELAVVIVIIGVLAAFGVPQFLKSVERSKCAEAFNYLSAVRSAEERFLAKNGIYWGGTFDAVGVMKNASSMGTVTDQLDIKQTAPKYFDYGVTGVVEDHTVAGVPKWELTLVRKAATSSYADYSVTFNQDGYLIGGPTLAASDVGGGGDISTLTEINPMGN